MNKLEQKLDSNCSKYYPLYHMEGGQCVNVSVSVHVCVFTNKFYWIWRALFFTLLSIAALCYNG